MCKEYINRIKIALAERNKTNRWLAEKTGKSDITISRWVQNKTQPSLEQVRNKILLATRNLIRQRTSLS